METVKKVANQNISRPPKDVTSTAIFPIAFGVNHFTGTERYARAVTRDIIWTDTHVLNVVPTAMEDVIRRQEYVWTAASLEVTVKNATPLVLINIVLILSATLKIVTFVKSPHLLSPSVENAEMAITSRKDNVHRAVQIVVAGRLFVIAKQVYVPKVAKSVGKEKCAMLKMS